MESGTDWSPAHSVWSEKMADVESLFDFVHMEIVAYFTNRPGKNIDVSIFSIKKRSQLSSCIKNVLLCLSCRKILRFKNVKNDRQFIMSRSLITSSSFGICVFS